MGSGHITKRAQSMYLEQERSWERFWGGVSLELSPDKHVGGYTEWDRVGRAACGLLQSGVPSRRSWWEAKLETEAGADYRGPGKPQ